MKQILLCISIFLTLCLNLNAQSINVNVEVSRTGYKTVTTSDGIHTIQGANATYTISLEGLGYVTEVVECQYIYNGQQKSLQFEKNDGKLTINPVQISSLPVTSEGANKFSVSLVVQESDKAGYTSLSGDGQDVWVYAEPTCELKRAPSQFIYMEKTSDNLEWVLNANGGGSWTYSWKISSEPKGIGNEFSVPVISDAGETTISVTAENKAPDNSTIWMTYSKEWKISVYEKPEVSLTSSGNDESSVKEFFQNMTWDLSATPTGGYPDGWTYEWKDGEEVLGKESTYAFGNALTEDIVNRHITLTVKNTAPIKKDEEAEWFSQTYHYYANFYPLPVIAFADTYPTNVIDGDEVSMGVSIKDQKNNPIDTDNTYIWTYYWNNVEGTNEYPYKASNPNNNDGISNLITLEVVGKLKKGDEQTYKAPLCQHTFMAWPKPNVEDLSERGTTKVECGGRPLELKVSATGGQKDGWTYEWYKDGVQITDATTNVYSKILERSSSESVITENYSIKVTNKCEGTIRKQQSYIYTVKLYPEPWAPQDINITDENRDINPTTGIREGNKVNLFCSECYGGYPGTWTYRWTEGDNIVSSNNSAEVTIDTYISGESKDYSKTVVLQCDINNSYNSTPWCSKTYTKNFTVYKRPKTPLSVVQKGNGTSGTVIATANVTDEDLEAHDYYLVFGYLDSNGVMHDESSLRQQNPGSVRWSTQIPASVINDSGNTLYVYALWKYGNGVEITSGLRTMNDVNEEWDGSTYSGNTRTVISASAKSINDSLTESFESDVKESYSINGMKSDRLNKGLNIVKMNDGKVKKVIVK